MKLVLIVSMSLACIACGNADNSMSVNDAGSNETNSSHLELICASNFCGNIVDKITGAGADCGNCSLGLVCGDNNIANVCGSACVSATMNGHSYTPACDYGLGNNWWVGYAAGGVQYAPTCNYTNPANCISINNPWPTNGECSGSVCGTFWCCLDDPDAGLTTLLPGAIANNDGGLP